LSMGIKSTKETTENITERILKKMVYKASFQ